MTPNFLGIGGLANLFAAIVPITWMTTNPPTLQSRVIKNDTDVVRIPVAATMYLTMYFHSIPVPCIFWFGLIAGRFK
jgi:hypothetical protein